MDTPASPNQPSPSAPPIPFETASFLSPREVERECRDLRYLVHLVMGVVVVLLATTTLALFHQIRSLVAQAGVWSTTSQEVGKAVREYETNAVPQLNRMFLEFQRFAETNPDFAKIMARYRISTEAPGTNAPDAVLPPAPPAR